MTGRRTMALLDSDDFVTAETGSQLYVSRYGEPVTDVAVGCNRDGLPMGDSVRMAWLCCSKPVTILALARALAAAGLDENERVARFLPEFASAGKDDVTLAHVLTHTVPYADLGQVWTGAKAKGNEHALMTASWPDGVRLICQTSLQAPPGTRVSYTSIANWHVLAAVLERLAGRPHEEVVADAVLSPLGMDCTSFYLTEEQAAAQDLGPLTILTEDAGPRTAGLDTPPLLFARWPGLACRGPARDMARPVECIAGWRDSGRLEPGWRAKLLEPRRDDLADPVFQGAEVLWSLGLCADPMCYGLPLAKRAVGYTGVRSSVVFADLDTGVTLSFISNGMVPTVADWARKRRLVAAVYADLDLAL
jgi:CubicO group peptidase (beta-lactamase class C family)